MRNTRPPTDPRLIAAAALRHPASLVLPSTAANALASMTERAPQDISLPERRLLVAVLALLVAAEIQEAHP